MSNIKWPQSSAGFTRRTRITNDPERERIELRDSQVYLVVVMPIFLLAASVFLSPLMEATFAMGLGILGSVLMVVVPATSRKRCAKCQQRLSDEH